MSWTLIVLYSVQNKAAWPDDALAAQLGTAVDVLRRKASFWVKHGVLTESPGRGKLTYTRALVLSSAEGGNDADDGPIAMEEDEGGSALVSQEEQLKQVCRYLVLLAPTNHTAHEEPTNLKTG